MPTSAHISESLLEQFAEDQLPAAEAAHVEMHLASCGVCSSTVEQLRALFEQLARLPRFAPSEGFEDAVISRVRIAPRESWVRVLQQRLLPSTRKGWALLSCFVTAPGVGLLLLALWVLTHPLLSPAALLQWILLRSQAAIQSALARLLDRAPESMFAEWVTRSLDLIEAVPLDALASGVVLLAVAIPLSAWGLIRLTRTPAGKVVHAK